jgi:hypothetical protein
MDRYDVIVAGTGAGGGTLARHLAPSGEADPPARAGPLAAARARELGDGGRLRSSGERPGETKLAPEWTLERIARHSVDLWLSTEANALRVGDHLLERME